MHLSPKISLFVIPQVHQVTPLMIMIMMDIPIKMRLITVQIRAMEVLNLAILINPREEL